MVKFTKQKFSKCYVSDDSVIETKDHELSETSTYLEIKNYWYEKIIKQTKIPRSTSSVDSLSLQIKNVYIFLNVLFVSKY